MQITQELIDRMKTWLGKDGHNFFTKVYKEHGTLNACWMEGSIPHPVHFREGMQVRNFMRSTGLCEDWDAHDFDNNWMEVVLRAIGENNDSGIHQKQATGSSLWHDFTQRISSLHSGLARWYHRFRALERR